MTVVEVKFKVFPTQTGVLLFGLAVGKAFTTTLPAISLDGHPVAFFTVKIYEILAPEAPALRFTVIEDAGKVASVTLVMPVPVIE